MFQLGGPDAKVTATGGAYTLFANPRGGVAEAAQDALAGMTQACSGPYEIARPENVMAPCQTDSDCDPGLTCYESRCRR